MRTQTLHYFSTLILFFFLAPSIVLSQANNVHDLLKKCQSEEALVVYKAVKDLEHIKEDQFDALAKSLLSDLLNEKTKHLDKVIKIAGFAGLDEELRAFAQKKKWNKDTRQVINLALVRSGDSEKTESLLRGIKKIPTEDEFSYNIVPSLVYARQKPILDNLLDRIMEKGDNCFPADMETEGRISCAYPIIEQVAPYIINFPVEVDDKGVIVEDFPKMLVEVREWISENKGSYEIDFSKY